MFPRDLAIEGTNFKRQHIFEALCRILLMYNYDDAFSDGEKTFYTSLEDLIKGKEIELTIEKILDLNVNEGSKAGIVDILFKVNKTQKNNEETEKKLNACEYVGIDR